MYWFFDESAEKKRYACIEYLIKKGIQCTKYATGYAPLFVEGHYVTFWHYIEPSIEKKDYLDFGAMLKNLHNQGNSYTGELCRYNKIDTIKKRLQYLEDHDIADDNDLAFLHDRLEKLSEAYANYRSVLGEGIIHGDAHAGNIIRHDKGQYLCDFDYLSIGAREWDLIPTIMGNKRFKLTDEEYTAFCEGYGYDALKQDNIKPLIHLRELSSFCWLYQNKGMSDKVDAEIQRRLTSIKNGDETAKWKAH